MELNLFPAPNLSIRIKPASLILAISFGRGYLCPKGHGMVQANVGHEVTCSLLIPPFLFTSKRR
jgi:hypothetical protein